MTNTHPKIGKLLATAAPKLLPTRGRPQNNRLPSGVIVGFVALLITFFLWRGFKHHEQEEIQHQIEIASNSFQVELQEQIEERILALIQISKRWELSGQPQRQDWEVDVNFILDRIGGYEAIAWVNTAGQINWVVPALDSQATQNLTNLVLKPWQPMGNESIQQNNQPIITQSISLERGQPGLLIYVRLMERGQFDGFLVGIVDTQKLFEGLIEFLKLYESSIFQGDQDNYDIAIYAGENLIYRDESYDQVEAMARWLSTRTLEIYDTTWRLEIYPKPGVIASTPPDYTEVILAAGVLMSLLLAGTVQLFETAQRRAQQLERSNQRLTQEIAEREQAERALLESRTRLKLLNSLSNRITAGMSVEQVVELTLEQMHEHFPHFRVLYGRLENNCFTIDHERKPDWMPSLQGLTEDLNISPQYRNALLSKQKVIIDDVALDPLTATSLAPTLIPSGSRSILDIPLQDSHHKLVGVLCFDAAKPHHWSQHEIALITEVAEYLTLAIQEAEAQTQRRSAEFALQRSEAQYRSMTDDVIDTSAVGICVMDASLQVVWINQSLEKFFKVKREEIIGQNKREMVRHYSPFLFEHHEACKSRILAAYENPEATLTFECHLLGQGDRPERWLEYWSCPIGSGLYEGGRIEHYYDITERKRAEVALQERQTRLRLLNNIATSVTAGMSVNQVIQSALEQISQTFKGLRVIYGTIDPHNRFYISHEISPPNMAPLQGYHEDLNQAPAYLKLLRDKQVIKISDIRQAQFMGPLIKMIQANDTLALLDVPLQHSQQLVGLLGLDAAEIYEWGTFEIETLSEIAEYLTVAIQEADARQTRQKLEDELDRIFNLSLDMLCVCSIEGQFKRINPAFERTLGYQSEELLAQPLLGFVHLNDQEVTIAELNKLSHGIPMVDFENRYRCHDGTYKWLAWSTVPVLADGLAYAVARDITERKKMEQMKDEFVAVTSHELRTPLTSLRASLSLLSTGQLGQLQEQGQQLLDFALTDAELLVRLVNDILDHQRLKFNKKPLDLTTCQVLPLLEKVKTMTQPAVDQAQIKLKLDIAEDCQIWAESDRVVQVLTNLINNAMKFSPSGSTITISAVPKNRHILFQVKDQGCGIAQDNLETIFEPFRTLDASDARTTGGTGLGLAICRSIVQAHHGAIWVESVVGRGTTFFFTLPQPQ